MIVTSMGFAVPAYQGEIEFKQHDNSKFSGHLKGDEYFSWIEDKQGNIVKYNKKSKNYEYTKIEMSNGKAELVATGITVNENKASFSTPKIKNNILKEKLFEIWTRKKNERRYHY